MPGKATQARRRLTHMPYADWCKECIEHRARPDRRERTDGVKRGSIPELSFDFCYTAARYLERQSQQEQTGYIHVVPLGSKSQFRLIAQELMHLSQLLGHSAIACASDNEPTTRQILKMLISARHSLGLTTRSITSTVLTGQESLQEVSLKVCSRDLVSG